MRNTARLLALILALMPVLARAQSAPANLPAQTVYGRLGIPGDTGPGQAIPFAVLLAQISAVQSANTVYAGPASGSAALPTFRALVGADLPNPGASSLGGVQSKAAVTHNFLTAISTSGVVGQAQPACADLSTAATSCSTDTTNASNISSGTLNAARLANNAITNALLAQMTANGLKGNNTGGASNVLDLTPGQVGAILCPPVRHVFISGTAATYTTDTCNGVTATWLEVEIQGGGSGGQGSGTTQPAGTVGNATTFSNGTATLTANGGGAPSSTAGGTGGTCSGTLGTQQNFPGTAGQGIINTAVAANNPGSIGGSSFYGGFGVGFPNNVGGTAPVNSGGGGAGGGGNTTASVFIGAGGGSGCHISTVITSGITATYTYTIGGTAAGGTAGTSGSAGGVGAAGLATVLAHWQ